MVVFKTLAQAGTSAEEKSSYRGLGLAEDGGDLVGAELFDGREQKDVALLSGEAVQLTEDSVDLLRVFECVIGGSGGGGEGFCEGVVELIGANATAAIQGEIPGDADEPDTHVADLWKGRLVLKHAEEGVLNDIFGIGSAAEDRVGDAKEEGRPGLDECGEVDLRPCTFDSRQRQAVSLNRRGGSHLHGQTCGEGDRSKIFMVSGTGEWELPGLSLHGSVLFV